ncbi:MAG: hypothetical protein HC769_08665 [Cyanobacteria bacterium CRU_2_1]|nr:hypothetical protein [Cyanobacteria bacterium CRU_2_1]
MPTSYSFAFQAQELPQKLSQTSKRILTGYWLCEFPDACQTHKVAPLYLSLSRGQVVFSGHQRLAGRDILKTLQRYVPRLRSEGARHTILALEQALIPKRQGSQSIVPLELLNELRKQNLVSIQEVVQAFRSKYYQISMNICLITQDMPNSCPLPNCGFNHPFQDLS